MTRDFPTNATEHFAPGSWLDRVIYVDLLATVTLSALAFGTVEPWSIAVFEINALLIAVLLALRFVLDPRVEWDRLRVALPLLALVVYGALQFIPIGLIVPLGSAADPGLRTLSRDPHATREATIKCFALAIYFVAALLTLRGTGRRKATLVLLSGFGFAVSVFAIVNRLTYNGKMYWVRPVSDYIAPYGPFGNYNHFAGFIELILPLSFAYLLLARTGIEQRLLWLFSVAIMAVAVIFSLSRGGTLAVGIEMLVLLAITGLGWKRLSRDDEHSSNKPTIVAVLASIVLIALWIGYDRLIWRFNATREGAGEFSVVTRVEYWQASWRMFLDRPLTGVGLGAFPAVYPSYGRSTAKYERLEQSHNDYLQLLTDAGAIGAALGLWFLIELVYIARRQFQKLRYVSSRARAIVVGGHTAVLGMLLHSLTDFNLQIASNALLFLFVLALTASIRLRGSHETPWERRRPRLSDSEYGPFIEADHLPMQTVRDGRSHDKI